MSRIDWHNRKYDDYCCCHIIFNLFSVHLIIRFNTYADKGDGITDYHIYKYYNANTFMLEKIKNSKTIIYGVFSSRKLLIKDLKSYNLL